MKSIMQKSKECYLCGRMTELQDHHVFFGTANRKLSEKHGLKLWLCREHHTGNFGVHHNYNIDLDLKRLGQEAFEHKHGSREQFMQLFGKNYLS